MNGDGIITFVMKVIEKVIGVLPTDPLTGYLDSYIAKIQSNDILGYLNYFVPFYLLVPIFETWLSVVAVVEIMKYRKEIFSKIQSIFGTFKK